MQKVSFIPGLFVLVCMGAHAMAQPSEKKLTAADYVIKFKEEAIQEMARHGVPASITLAQAMLESANGNSPLAVYANNHFGIKCHVGWEGLTYSYDDDEKNECFRRYEDPFESFKDHSLFLKSRPRYAFLFSLPKSDYRGWANGLKTAGYATNPHYGELLIDLIERFHLNELDRTEQMATIKPDINASANPPAQPELRGITSFNHTRFVNARSGDTYAKIANDFHLKGVRVAGYNDADNPNEPLKEGEKVYVQAKARRSEEYYHYVKEGETMKNIAQQYGIKLRALYRINNMRRGEQPIPGAVLNLSGKRPEKQTITQR